MTKPDLTEVQKAYNVAQSEMFQLAAYGHHRYHPLQEILTPEGKQQQRDYNDRLLKARDDLEAGLLRLVAEHAQTYFNDWDVVAAWLRFLADDPGELSMLVLRPDERADETFDDWNAESMTAQLAATKQQPAFRELAKAWGDPTNVMPPCPNCGAQRIIVRLRRWPWQRAQRWRCYGCFTKFQADEAAP